LASIYAWTRGLLHRAKLDHNSELENWCYTLEDTCRDTVEGGKMTKDLAIIVHGTQHPDKTQYLNTELFIQTVAENLKKNLSKKWSIFYFIFKKN